MNPGTVPLDTSSSQETDLRELGQLLARGEQTATSRGQGVVSDFSLDEVLLLHSMGLEPAGLVFGVGVMTLGLGAWQWVTGTVDVANHAFRRALAEAKEAIRSRAAQLKAIGVVGVEVEIRCASKHYAVVITGTAVHADPGQPGRHPLQDAYRRPFLCDLSARDFVVLSQSGWYPIDLVGGACYVHAPRRSASAAIGQSTQNIELSNFTETLYQARETAMLELQRELQLAGGTGMVDVKLVDRPVPFARHVVEFVIYGTAIKRLAPEHTHPNVSVVVPLDDEVVTFEAEPLG